MRVAAKFLSERERRGVLQVSAADLYDPRKLGGLFIQRRFKLFDRGQQLFLQLLHKGYSHRRRIGVV